MYVRLFGSYCFLFLEIRHFYKTFLEFNISGRFGISFFFETIRNFLGTFRMVQNFCDTFPRLNFCFCFSRVSAFSRNFTVLIFCRIFRNCYFFIFFGVQEFLRLCGDFSFQELLGFLSLSFLFLEYFQVSNNSFFRISYILEFLRESIFPKLSGFYCEFFETVQSFFSDSPHSFEFFSISWNR